MRWGWLALVLVASCEAADAVPLGECGNGVIEPTAGEDCEPVQGAAACGGVGTGASACRFICDVDDCPGGFRCGADNICRRPCVGHEGEPACRPFEMLSTDVTTAEVAAMRVVDVDGDDRPEVFAIEARAGTLAGQVYAYEGAAFAPAGAPAPVGGPALLTRLDSGGPYHLIAASSSLPLPPATDPALAQAFVFELREDLGFREVILQGPDSAPDGALRLGSYALPADVPADIDTAGLFAFTEDGAWAPPPGAVALPGAGDPGALVGPTQGQVVAATEALASVHCDVLLYGFAGDTELHATNPCAAIPGWSEITLRLPSVPWGIGDGVVLADANDDGLHDLVVTTAEPRIRVAYAVGDGTFHSSTPVPATEGDGAFDQGVGSSTAVPSLGVIAAADFNRDGRLDFITRSGWIRSCTVEGCGTCDVAGYRCDAAPAFTANAASVVERDGDQAVELAVFADASDPTWGALEPAGGALVVIENPATAQWSGRVLDVGTTTALASSGDIDGDARDELVLVDRTDAGDELVVVFATDDRVWRGANFSGIVDAHVVSGSEQLAIVSEEADGRHRRLSRLSTSASGELRSVANLALQAIPRRFIGGRFHREDEAAAAGARALAVVGELGDEVGIELITRGGSSFFDGSTRIATVTPLGIPAADAATVHGIAIDLDADDTDEVVVFAADGLVRTLRVDGTALVLTGPPEAVTERYAAAPWPDATGVGPGIGAVLGRRDLDGDGDPDLWALTADNPPLLAAFRNTGNGSLDISGRTITPLPPVELSVCDADPAECSVQMTALAAFAGPSDRSISVSEDALDLVLVSHRALWHWTVDPLAAAGLPPVEVAVVLGSRDPLGPAGTAQHVALRDVDGDGVDDVIAGGTGGIRWLRGLAVNP